MIKKKDKMVTGEEHQVEVFVEYPNKVAIGKYIL